MPQWIHDRAKRLQEKNPDMPESKAWAIATQQSHALGKSPKGYGTAEGKRVAKKKYDTPGDDQKTASVLLFAFGDELEKIALPRYEQEIQAGNIQRSALGPNLPNVQGGLLGPAARKMTRDQLHAPAPVDPGALARKRQLNDHLYHAQAAAPHAATGIQVGGVSKEMLPGAFAATLPGITGKPQVYSPPQSGQFMRGMGGGFTDRMKATGAAMAPQHAGALLPPSSSVDPTINKAVLHHELGEASEMGKPAWRPFASHLGPEPIIRENMAMQGDPEAMGHMAKLRQMHPDDALAQKAIRHAGGTPDSPIPIGGRQHRAVEGYIDRNVQKINPTIRGQRLMGAVASGKELAYASPEVHGAARQVMEGIPATLKQPSLMGKLRSAKELVAPGRVLNRFLRGR